MFVARHERYGGLIRSYFIKNGSFCKEYPTPEKFQWFGSEEFARRLMEQDENKPYLRIFID